MKKVVLIQSLEHIHNKNVEIILIVKKLTLVVQMLHFRTHKNQDKSLFAQTNLIMEISLLMTVSPPKLCAKIVQTQSI
jgi:hypothetical protein